MSTPHLPFRHGHDPFWRIGGSHARGRRRLKTALDIVILVVAIIALAVVFGARPVAGF